MKERMQLISLFETGKYTMTELARSFGVSRKTVHKWVARFKEDGISGLDDRSRAPYRRPRSTPQFVVAALLRAKRAHPTWGPAGFLQCPVRPLMLFEHGLWSAPEGGFWPLTDWFRLAVGEDALPLGPDRS
jgi:transposase